jgi:uncharacterized integral membrane protein
MQKKLIFLLVFMVLIAIFALQNSVEVEIKLWFWSVRTSMVLILILTFAAGALAGIIFSLPKRSKVPVKEKANPVEQAAQQERESGTGEVNDPVDDDEFEDVRN